MCVIISALEFVPDFDSFALASFADVRRIGVRRQSKGRLRRPSLCPEWKSKRKLTALNLTGEVPSSDYCAIEIAVHFSPLINIAFTRWRFVSPKHAAGSGKARKAELHDCRRSLYAYAPKSILVTILAAVAFAEQCSMRTGLLRPRSCPTRPARTKAMPGHGSWAASWLLRGP